MLITPKNTQTSKFNREAFGCLLTASSHWLYIIHISYTAACSCTAKNHPVPRTRVPSTVAQWLLSCKLSLSFSIFPHLILLHHCWSAQRSAVWHGWSRLSSVQTSKQPFTTKETPYCNNTKKHEVFVTFHYHNGSNWQTPHITSESEVKHTSEKNALGKTRGFAFAHILLLPNLFFLFSVALMVHAHEFTVSQWWAMIHW